MKKLLLWSFIMLLNIIMIATFALAGCKKTEAAATTAAETTAAATNAAETTTAATTAEETTAAVNLTLMHAMGGIAFYQGYFEKIGEKTKELMNISITPVPYPSTDAFIAAVTAALPTDEAPDIFTWWSTYRMKSIIDQGLVAKTTAIWDKHKDEYAPGLRDAFTFDGEVYGHAYGIDYYVVWYNKDVFAKLGLIVPETWDEFIKICETLKANDITPLAQSVVGRWPTLLMFQQLMIDEDPDLYVDLCEGRVKYTDERVKKVFELWRDMIEKGYFSDPGLEMFAKEAPALFNQDKLGMVYCATWYFASCLEPAGVPIDKCGVFILPPHNPGSGKNIITETQPFVESENSKNLEATMKVVDWLMGKEGSEFVSKMTGKMPLNMKADTSYLPEVYTSMLNYIKDGNYRILNRYWEATPTQICEEAVDKFAEFILKPDNLDNILADLGKIADEYWAKNK